MTLRNFSSTAVSTTLSGAVTASATTLPVSATTGFPAAPFVLALEPGTGNQELALVTAVAGLNLTVSRGYDSTTGVSHNSGAVVQHSHGAVDFREANSHVNTTTGVHGLAGAVVGTTDAQTLTSKTLVEPKVDLIKDSNGNDILIAQPGPSAVNRVTVGNAATGLAPYIGSGGSDTNVNLDLRTRGAGLVTANGLAVVDVFLAQTLVNKTISVDDNTVSGIAASSFVLSNGSGNISGSAAQKVIPAGVVVGTTDTQTLSGKTLTAPVIADATNITGAWVSYSPTLAGWTLGNGILTGKSVQIGKTIHFKIAYTIGSSDTIAAANPGFSFPSTPIALDVVRQPMGTATLFDTSANAFRLYVAAAFSAAQINVYNPDGTPLSNTVPWAWATGDQIVLTGTYEAA